ncbi:MAG: transcription initiation factor IIB [Candidatus Thermoplasmatota archaeon]|nr:transcription initiation factor IIB [Candidatus Thermoplasmatota archaeon]MBS3789400.1 transcription initiation factor IIB [Candidatus Thermoplasmatota archaeon]
MSTETRSKGKDKPIIERVTECPECGSSQLAQDYDRGEFICEECGLVIDDQYIDQGPEWRAFDMKQEENRARAGPAMTEMMHDRGLSTKIDDSNRDSQGRALSNSKKSQMYRLRKWQRRSRVSGARESTLISALSEIKRLASTMGLPNHVKERSASIYRKAVEKNLIRGRSVKIVATAVLYTACRELDLPRTLDEFAEVTEFDRKEIGRTYRFLKWELNMKLEPTKPQNYLQKFCNELKLGGEVKKLAEQILNRAEEEELLSGKGPTGLAAAAIYIAGIKVDERRTQIEIADVADVTEVTVRNRYKELADELDLTVDV